MKLILYVLLMGVAEVGVYCFLHNVLGFSKLAVLYLLTTVLGAVILLLRYPAFRAAKETSDELFSTWKEEQNDLDYLPLAEDSDRVKLMVFVYVYLPALVLIVVPGIVTDLIGMLLLVPAISNRCTEKISDFDFYRLIRLSEAFDDHPEAKVDVGSFLWIHLGVVLTICVSFIWLWGLKGAVAAVFVSTALVVAFNQIWRFYSSYSIHADGLRGYNQAHEILSQYDRGGAQHHRIMRSFWMHRWAHFLYDQETMRWSWRPYVLLSAFAGILYWSPLLGGAIVAAFMSMLLKVANDIRVPTALYLGSSDTKSHELLRKLRGNSGIDWVSLLDDTVILDTTSESPIQEDDHLAAAELMGKTNRWSLRINEAEDWMAVVKDFIRASAVIVVRPENEGAVREEIEVLANAENLQRIILIRTDGVVEGRLPEQLKNCVLDEDQAIALIAQIKSRPKTFRERIRDRFGEAS